MVLGLIAAALAGAIGTTELALWSLGVTAVATVVSGWRGQRRIGRRR